MGFLWSVHSNHDWYCSKTLNRLSRSHTQAKSSLIFAARSTADPLLNMLSELDIHTQAVWKMQLCMVGLFRVCVRQCQRYDMPLHLTVNTVNLFVECRLTGGERTLSRVGFVAHSTSALPAGRAESQLWPSLKTFSRIGSALWELDVSSLLQSNH